MLGLPRGIVRLVPYCNEWGRLFAGEAARIAARLGSHAIRIEHVGSTAIPGLDAKPILDIVVAVPSLAEAAGVVPALEELGYVRRPNGDTSSRLFLVRGPEHARTHHLSLTEERSPAWNEHVHFRDYLLRNGEARDEYQALKRRLSESEEGFQCFPSRESSSFRAPPASPRIGTISALITTRPTR
jgi:GrpB-like predicted nucleotidyltransferase (UPF0157 family)